MGVIALSLALIGVAYSQDKKPDDKKTDDKPPVVAKDKLPQYYKRLGLREEQQQRIFKIRADAKAKVDDLDAKLKKVRADEKQQLEKVLTPEQLKLLRELRSGEKASDK